LFVKAVIRQQKPLDVRIAIGLGQKEHHADKISPANGTAFVNSGNCFEHLKKRRLALKSNNVDFDNILNIEVLELDENDEGSSLKYAGRYIGMLECPFVFGFILVEQWSAIGFLIAAKSVFRFWDLNKGNNRKLTKYVLIGTLLRFGFAILTGLDHGYLNSLVSGF